MDYKSHVKILKKHLENVIALANVPQEYKNSANSLLSDITRYEAENNARLLNQINFKFIEIKSGIDSYFAKNNEAEFQQDSGIEQKVEEEASEPFEMTKKEDLSHLSKLTDEEKDRIIEENRRKLEEQESISNEQEDPSYDGNPQEEPEQQPDIKGSFIERADKTKEGWKVYDDDKTNDILKRINESPEEDTGQESHEDNMEKKYQELREELSEKYNRKISTLERQVAAIQKRQESSEGPDLKFIPPSYQEEKKDIIIDTALIGEYHQLKKFMESRKMSESEKCNAIEFLELAVKTIVAASEGLFPREYYVEYKKDLVDKMRKIYLLQDDQDSQ